MKHNNALKNFILFGLCALALTGCVNREQADAALAKGCAAGVRALLPEGYALGEIRNRHFSPSPEAIGARHVRLTAIEMDGYLEDEVTYDCIFEENFGFMNSGHVASIYQIRIHDRVIGKSGNQIQGDFNEFLQLTDAIRKAMYGGK